MEYMGCRLASASELLVAIQVGSLRMHCLRAQMFVIHQLIKEPSTPLVHGMVCQNRTQNVAMQHETSQRRKQPESNFCRPVSGQLGVHMFQMSTIVLELPANCS